MTGTIFSGIVQTILRLSYNGSLSKPSKLMTRVRLPSAAEKSWYEYRLFFILTGKVDIYYADYLYS